MRDAKTLAMTRSTAGLSQRCNRGEKAPSISPSPLAA